MKKEFRKKLSLLLVMCLLLPILPVTSIEVNAASDDGELQSVSDAVYGEDVTVSDAVYGETVDYSTYGWALEDAVKNEDGTVSITIMEVPNFEEKTYTTAISLDDEAHTNSVTGVTRADALVYADFFGDFMSKDAFVEIQFNAANQCINMEIIEYSDIGYMDSASYGGELTAKGGGAGNMVSTGWILNKNQSNNTITIGDGNHVTNVFEETYTLADDCKIYKVNNPATDGTVAITGRGPAYNVEGDYSLIEEGSFSDIDVTEKGDDGEIYYVPERYTAVCIFDSNYESSWKDGTAKIKELYLMDNPLVLNEKDMATPDGMQYNGTSWYPAKNKLEEVTSFSFTGSCEPIEIMKDRLYDVGDAYTDIYLFIGDDGTLSLLDQGNRNASYQYWLNIEKVGYDPRDVDNIVLTHGHGDHYQGLYENCLMIRRAGGIVNAYINPYSQGATVSNDEVSYELDATLNDKPTLYSVSDELEWDTWLNFMGDGIDVYIWRAIGHSNDTASFVFKATATADDEYFEADDTVSWVYFGGYGARTTMSYGANRLQIIYSMMYQQALIAPWAEAQSDYVYPLAQHTNQYPQHEVYKAAKIAGIPYSEALTEGSEGIGNFMEKRISVGFYEWMEQAYQAETDTFGDIIEASTEFRCSSSGRGYLDTVQAHGPFKREEGEYTVDVKAVNVVHGYDAFQNPNDKFAGQTNIYGFDLSEGIVIDKDSYTHDPDGWYVQVVCNVNDDYDGCVDYDENASYTSGANDEPYEGDWPSGPVEKATNPDNWVEILRTERFDSQEEAEAFAEALTNNGYADPYQVYGIDGNELYSHNGTDNLENPIAAITAANAASYKVNLSNASEILLGDNFEDTFRGEGEVSETVDHIAYGWALEDAVKNEDGTVSITIMEVPNFEEKTYTTAISLDDEDHTNSVTGVTRADAMTEGDILEENAFVEVQFNAANQCVNMEVIEYSDIGYMDSASYGGELTAKGGGAGNMVSTGWILNKDQDNNTITIGDGNHVTNVFEETYTLADDCKIYKVNNPGTDGTVAITGRRAAYNVEGDYSLVEEGSFTDIDVTEKGDDGEIYYVPERYTAVCIFDSNYESSWKDGTAKIKELYLMDNPLVLNEDDMATPDGMQYNGTSWYPAKNKLEEVTSFSFTGSCEPIEIMKDRLYDVGDAYTDIYLFIGDNGKLSLLDQGNRNASYQYWLNIEKAGYDPRDIDNIVLTHGHVDHYQALYENCLMIRRAGGTVNSYINPYTQGATITNDDNASYELSATLTEEATLYNITDVVEWDKWQDFMGDGISVYAWRAIGHSNDTASYVFKLTATADDEYFEAGDTVSWVYFGGYGARTTMSYGAGRLQIVYSMMYEQSVIAPWAEAQSDYVYPLAQHTNQYPQHEVYKAAKIAGIPYSEALTEGSEGIGNFMEKRISVGFYEWMEQAYQAETDTFGDIIEAATGFRCSSSGRGYLDTIQAHGPFKREEGEYTVDVKAVNVVHGYNAFQNPNDKFAGQTNIYGFDLSEGIVIDKDSYTHDPDGWYVQVVCNVNDDYDGCVDYDENASYTSGANDEPYEGDWPSGPVEKATNPGNWVEILRTERFDSQEEAEAFAEALTNNGYADPYQVYGIDGNELYSHDGTDNLENPIAAITTANAASYKVNLSNASEILLGDNFEDTFKKEETIYGISKVYASYHQLAAIAVEYDSNVTAPVFDESNPAYTIRDYAGPYMREEYDKSPNGEYSEAKITAIYTNSEPSMREDKTSVPGKYVIIELAHIKEVEPYDGACDYRPLHNAVLATWRQQNEDLGIDDTCERIRKDYSDVVISQNVNIKDSENNEIVCEAGNLPELLYENLTNIELDEFKQGTITTKELGSTAHFGYYIPENYDPDKKYPMVIYMTGNSGRLEFSDDAVLGDEPENLGGNLTRDRMSMRWLNENEDVIVVAPQTSRLNVPYDYDAQDEISSIIDYFIDEYNVDTDRVYALGSSMGTRQFNEYLMTHADKIAAFVSCNGFTFTNVSNKFAEGYTRPFTGENQKTKEEVLSWGDEVRQDEETYAESLVEAKEAFSDIVKYRVPMWYYHAVNDETLPVTMSMTNYEILREMYEEEGLSEEEIDELVKLVLYDNEEMLAEGVVEFHGAVKKASVEPDLGKNLLSISKNYTVNFEGGSNVNGEAPEMIIVKRVDAPKIITLPENTFNRNKYRFKGWGDGSRTYDPGDTYEVTADTVFTAVWSRKSSGGGSSSSDNDNDDSENNTQTDTSTDVPDEVVPEQSEDNSFDDVENHWAKKSVEFVVERKLFNGVSDDSFSPDTSMTRGMFVTVLGRLAQADTSNPDANFSDVPDNAWFAGNVAWAVNNGIVNGVGDGKFAPDTEITREQLCVMIVNYAEYSGINLGGANGSIDFADSENVSGWALEAVEIAQKAGLIQGKTGNNFDPQGTATRAEVAIILQRLIENYID